MKCFVIMPFAKDFGDVYATIRRAVDSVREGQAHTFRLDEVKAAGRITDDLVRELNESAICIADLTGCNPNVMWEVGYAMALRKPVIFISQDVSSLPFDLRLMRTIQYVRHDLADTLERQLAESFRETLGAFALEREGATKPLPQASVLSVAVTGSMQANRARCLRRLETLLEPYLGKAVTWYCGSYGDVDQVTCEFLVHKRERKSSSSGTTHTTSPNRCSPWLKPTACRSWMRGGSSCRRASRAQPTGTCSFSHEQT